MWGSKTDSDVFWLCCVNQMSCRCHVPSSMSRQFVYWKEKKSLLNN